VIPAVHDIDAFTDLKEKGIAYEPPEHYEDIHLPKNSAKALVNGALAFGFGFAMIWYIWWLAGLCALGMLVTIIARACDDDTEYILSATEVERRERLRLQQVVATTAES
ncbi:MAG: cytochrome o ubiquinol oxidase subunit I, partial [Deltaproteobacteria bacterium]